MNQELYHYAMALKNKNLSNISIICVWILLAIFLIPLLLSNIVLALFLLFTYLTLYFCSKKCVDNYDKELLNVGLFLLFLGIEFSALVLIQYKIFLSLVIALFFCLCAYEIIFFIKIKKKMFSQATRNSSPWIHIVPSIFGATGIWFGKLIAKSEKTDITIWIVILLCSLLITYSFSFFKRFFIRKIINK